MLESSHQTYFIRRVRCLPLNTSLREQSCWFSEQIASLPKLLNNIFRRLLKQKDANKIYDVLALDSPQRSIMDSMKALALSAGIDLAKKNDILDQLLQNARKRKVSYLIQTRDKFLEPFDQSLINFKSTEDLKGSYKNYGLMIFTLQVIQSLIDYIKLGQSQKKLAEALQKCGISKKNANKKARTLRLNMVKKNENQQ